MIFIPQAIDNGKPPRVKPGAQFVKRVFCADFSPYFRLRRTIRTVEKHKVVVIIFGVCGVEFKTVYTEFVHQSKSLLFKPRGCRRICKIKYRAVSVPPMRNSGCSVRFFYERAEFFQFAENRRIGTYERTTPQHDLKTRPVQFINHCFRIGKGRGVELPVSVCPTPAIVDH